MEEMNNVAVENQETGIIERNDTGETKVYDLGSESDEKTLPVGKVLLGIGFVTALAYGGRKLWKRWKNKKTSQDEEYYEYAEEDEPGCFEEVPAEEAATESKAKRK